MNDEKLFPSAQFFHSSNELSASANQPASQLAGRPADQTSGQATGRLDSASWPLVEPEGGANQELLVFANWFTLRNTRELAQISLSLFPPESRPTWKPRGAR